MGSTETVKCAGLCTSCILRGCSGMWYGNDWGWWNARNERLTLSMLVYTWVVLHFTRSEWVKFAECVKWIKELTSYFFSFSDHNCGDIDNLLNSFCPKVYTYIDTYIHTYTHKRTQLIYCPFSCSFIHTHTCGQLWGLAAYYVRSLVVNKLSGMMKQ